MKTYQDLPIGTRLRWAVRRRPPKHLWYRIRLRIRRRRWEAIRIRAVQNLVSRPDVRPTAGLATVIGDFSGTSGLSRAAIYDLDQLRSRHSEIIPVDISRCRSGEHEIVPQSNPIENLYLFCQPDNYEHIQSVATPGALKNAWRVGKWVWETPIFPRRWRFAAPLLHEVWAPSEFCAAVFRQNVSVPVRVIPHEVTPPKRGSIDMRLRLGIPQAAFMGLSIMDIRSCPARKNPWAHVLAWKKAFDGRRDAILVVKLRTSKRTRLVLRELMELVHPHENIIFIDTDYSGDEIASLQHACDVFLSLHRSEGYGLNIHEALLCGKPTIATDWSANSEYGPAFENYRGVTYRLVRYRDWLAHYEEKGFWWADANLDHASDELRSAYATATGIR